MSCPNHTYSDVFVKFCPCPPVLSYIPTHLDTSTELSEGGGLGLFIDLWLLTFDLWYYYAFQLTEGYREKRKIVDGLKEQLQQKINDYSKLSEHGRSCNHQNDELDDSVGLVRVTIDHAIFGRPFQNLWGETWIPYRSDDSIMSSSKLNSRGNSNLGDQGGKVSRKYVKFRYSEVALVVSVTSKE